MKRIIGFTAFLVKQVAYHLKLKKNNKLKKIVEKSKMSIYYFFPAAHIESINLNLLKLVNISTTKI